MKTIRRSFAAIRHSLFASSALITLSTTAHAQGDRLIGRWTLDLTRSTFEPGPAPAAETLTVVSISGGIRIVVRTTRPDGGAGAFEWTWHRLDGAREPMPGFATVDSTAYRRVDPFTSEVINSKAGAVVAVTRRVVFADGSTLTATQTATIAGARPINNRLVYRRDP